jgi:hypothetical protein
MPSGSPVPVNPISLPSSFPEGGYNQGLAGAGVQYASTGGVIGMQAGRQIPTNSRDYAVGKAIIAARGENLAQYRMEDIERIGREGDPEVGYPFPWWSRFAGDEHMGWKAHWPPSSQILDRAGHTDPTHTARTTDTPPQPDSEIPYWKRDDYTPPLDYLDVLEGQSLTPEIEWEQETGRKIGAPTRWEQAESRVEGLRTPERYPYGFMSEEEKMRLPASERWALGMREAGTGLVDDITSYGPAAGGTALDFGTVLLTGDPSDPAKQRAEMWEAAKELPLHSGIPRIGMPYGYNVLSELPYALSDQGLREMWEGIQGEAEQLPTDAGEWWDAIKGVGGDIQHISGVLADEYLPDALSDQGLREMWDTVQETGLDPIRNLITYSPEGEGFGEGMLDTVTEWVGDFWDDAKPKEGTSHNAKEADAERAITEYTGMASMTPVATSGDLSLDEAEGEGLEIIDIGGGTTVGGTSDNEVMDMLLKEHASFGDAQKESAESLRSLIAQNRAETKSRAFNLGMAALGAGIAKGDMGAGMDEAVKVASNTLARGEAAVAPLEAAAVTEKSQSSRDRLESLAQIARADAGYRQVRAQLAREGGLNARNYNTLKVATMRAVENLMEGTYIEGTETAEGTVQVFNQLMNMLMGDVGTLMDSQADSYQGQLVRNPEGSPSTFRYVVPQS